ncbi:hypothetical protein Pelo_17837 [Pelomyxa schiedti]|nr:hypothetical protein Pelo_17837 [Pelomyxa schiedti]
MRKYYVASGITVRVALYNRCPFSAYADVDNTEATLVHEEIQSIGMPCTSQSAQISHQISLRQLYIAYSSTISKSCSISAFFLLFYPRFLYRKVLLFPLLTQYVSLGMMSILVICQWPLSKRVFDCHLSGIISNFVEDSLPACLLRGEDALYVSMFTRRTSTSPGKSGVSVEVALSDQNHLCATHSTPDDTAARGNKEAELINNEEMLTLVTLQVLGLNLCVSVTTTRGDNTSLKSAKRRLDTQTSGMAQAMDQ